MSNAMPYIPPFRITPREFTLHNSAPDPFELKWAGLMFTIPACNVVGPRAAKDEDGDPIPGTCILRDASAPGPDGVVARVWSAEDAIRNVLGINVDTGFADGMAARAGISFLPDTPSKQIVREIREAGERRWKESQVEWAEHEVAARQAAMQLAKEHGTVPPTPGPDYRKAVMIIDEYHKRLDATYGKPVEEIVSSVTEEDEIEMETYLMAAALEKAKKIAAEKEIDQKELAERMLQDPRIRRHLSKEYSIRKRGRTEEASFEAAPQSIEVPDAPDPGEPPGEE